MEKLAVLAFSEEEGPRSRLQLIERDCKKPSLKLEKYLEIDKDFYPLLKDGSVEELSEALRNTLTSKDVAGRFFYVTLPDSLVSYQIISREAKQAPNLAKKEELDNFLKFCLKENIGKKETQGSQNALVGVYEEADKFYYTLSFTAKSIIEKLTQAFAVHKKCLLAIEPNFVAFSRLLTLKFPLTPCLFSAQGNYFLLENQMVFSLYTSETENMLNKQVLLALRQKTFTQNMTEPNVKSVSVLDLQELPPCFHFERRHFDYVSLCALGSALREVETLTGKKEEAHGWAKIRQFFKRTGPSVQSKEKKA